MPPFLPARLFRGFGRHNAARSHGTPQLQRLGVARPNPRNAQPLKLPLVGAARPNPRRPQQRPPLMLLNSFFSYFFCSANLQPWQSLGGRAKKRARPKAGRAALLRAAALAGAPKSAPGIGAAQSASSLLC